MAVLTDIEIARQNKMVTIEEVAKKLNLDDQSLHTFGHHIAKIDMDTIKKLPNKNSKLILLTNGEKLRVLGISKAKFLLISGKPIGEKIARGGPFVMNTKSEILQAVQDYHNGTFVK